ncbi:MAG: hypothetical protein GY724_11080 [Actinomycetia bacterium]|nr:hypothetical protein [Actinomycetes bacterium]MCP4224566.1 hypothetical protein [Actinomycetes bacterium]MCP5031427.1 hypothetical protein [Actinomycetes bacterium]
MDSLSVARSMRGSIGMLAMEWLMAPSTLEKAEERGMPAGQAAYAVGRLGVLGDCPVDNVVGAAYFWHGDLMRKMVSDGRAQISPAEGAKIYAGICQEWGEEKLGDFAGSDRLGQLLEKVVSTASPLGAPTFVGWRDQERPSEGPGLTFLLAQTMRELRFGRHTVAVQASGMGPLEAILSGPAGEWNAEMFGWPKPYPGVEQLGAQREAIEAHTDKLHAPDLDVLDDSELSELRQLAKEARAHTSHPS